MRSLCPTLFAQCVEGRVWQPVHVFWCTQLSPNAQFSGKSGVRLLLVSWPPAGISHHTNKAMMDSYFNCSAEWCAQRCAFFSSAKKSQQGQFWGELSCLITFPTWSSQWEDLDEWKLFIDAAKASTGLCCSSNNPTGTRKNWRVPDKTRLLNINMYVENKPWF